MQHKNIKKECEELWAKNKYYVLSKSHKAYLDIREYLKEKEVDIAYLQENGVTVGPAKAANAGGVACSCMEMAQNAEHLIWSEERVYAELEGIMVNIHKLAADACERYELGYDLVKGANIAGFERVAEAMMLQGVV